MNKEQLFEEIDEIYSEWHGGELHIGKERTERIKEALNRAINFIPCSTQLKDKETISFEDFKRIFKNKKGKHEQIYCVNNKWRGIDYLKKYYNNYTNL